MNCLHCHQALPLLKRLSDARFCSADHEREWNASRQSMMLERLRISGEQFRRAVQASKPNLASAEFPLSTDAPVEVRVDEPQVIAS